TIRRKTCLNCSTVASENGELAPCYCIIKSGGVIFAAYDQPLPIRREHDGQHPTHKLVTSYHLLFNNIPHLCCTTGAYNGQSLSIQRKRQISPSVDFYCGNFVSCRCVPERH